MTTTQVTDGHWPLARKAPSLGAVTAICCECGAEPKRLAGRGSMRHVWHQTHRRGLGLQPVEYMWPEDRYMRGLSTGGYVQMRGYRWVNRGWEKERPAAVTVQQIRDALRAALDNDDSQVKRAIGLLPAYDQGRLSRLLRETEEDT